MFDTRQERQAALGFGQLWFNYPYPDGELAAVDRSYMWGSFGAAPSPNEYYIADHADRAIDLLLEQFKLKPNIEGVIRATAASLQELENVFGDLLTQRYLDVAIGAQLDIIGIIVGLDREGRDDSTYRIALRTKISLNHSSGTPAAVIEAARFYTGASNVWYRELKPATIYVFTDGQSVPSDLHARIQEASPTGVDLNAVTNPGVAFEFSSVDGVSETATGTGFAETNYLVGSLGGQLSEIAT